MRGDQWLSYPAPCTFFFSCPWNEGVAFILSLFSAVVSPHSRLVHIVCLAWLSFVIFFIFCIPGCLLSVHLPKSTHVYAITHSSNTDFSQPISPLPSLLLPLSCVIVASCVCLLSGVGTYISYLSRSTTLQNCSMCVYGCPVRYKISLKSPKSWCVYYL